MYGPCEEEIQHSQQEKVDAPLLSEGAIDYENRP